MLEEVRENDKETFQRCEQGDVVVDMRNMLIPCNLIDLSR